MRPDLAIFPIRQGMRLRDLPSDFRCAFEAIDGAMPKVAFKGGKFFKVVWINIHPLDWPTRAEFPLEKGDALVIDADYGVDGRILGAIHD